jgi:hypothetical protein
MFELTVENPAKPERSHAVHSRYKFVDIMVLEILGPQPPSSHRHRVLPFPRTRCGGWAVARAESHQEDQPKTRLEGVLHRLGRVSHRHPLLHCA